MHLTPNTKTSRKNNPYFGLIMCLLVGGGFWFGVYKQLRNGRFAWGYPPSTAIIITRSKQPFRFWLGTSAFAVAATLFIFAGISEVVRHRRRAKARRNQIARR